MAEMCYKNAWYAWLDLQSGIVFWGYNDNSSLEGENDATSDLDYTGRKNRFDVRQMQSKCGSNMIFVTFVGIWL